MEIAGDRLLEQAYHAGAQVAMHHRAHYLLVIFRGAHKTSRRRPSSRRGAFRRVGPLHANARIALRCETVKGFLEGSATVGV